MGRPAGRQRQPQADGAKAEKQTNVEKATDMQQRHAENKRKGGECKEKDVSRRKGQGAAKPSASMKDVNLCAETVGLGWSGGA